MNALIVLIALIDPASAPASQASSFPASEAAITVQAEPKESKHASPFMRDVRISYGFKGTVNTTQSYAAIGASSFQPQSALSLSYAVWSIDRFALAPGVSWEASLSTGGTRGASVRHSTHRFLVSLDARYRPLRWLDVFGRGAVGVLASDLSLSDGTSSLLAKNTAATGDLSAGIDFLLGPQKRVSKRAPRVWASLEGGYSWTSLMQIALVPQLASDDPRKTGTTNAGNIGMQGPFFRFGLTLAL